MITENCEKRQQILEATGNVLVLGGPGSGKTTIALRKAVRLINAGLQPGQAILFLSFSRAAVARLGEASRAEVAKAHRHQLSIQTFHSFCWELLQSHGYLIGCPKRRLEVLLPHEEKALSGGLKPPEKWAPPSAEWTDWQAERERLFREKGRIAFDLFAPRAAELLQRCALIRELVASRFPVIIVDEAQDTGPEAWRCIEILSATAQIVCLGDLSQQIFDHLDGVGPERIAAITEILKPIIVDLGEENNRSPNGEIVTFANDIFSNQVRGCPYAGVTRQRYDPKGDPCKRLRIALARVNKSVKKATGKWPENIAILATTGSGVARISSALNNCAKPIRHKVLFDEAVALQASQFAAFLLEPRTKDNYGPELVECLKMLSDLKRISGGKSAINDGEKYLKWATAIVQGKALKQKLPCALITLLHKSEAVQLSGDPRKDWLTIRLLLQQSGHPEIAALARHLEYLIAFNRGKRIAANLSAMWIEGGAYTMAREAVKSALVEDQLLSGTEDLTGIHVMTIHKSKGKEFDAVIIVCEGQRLDANKWQSSFVWRGDPPPYYRSRKILRVAITRARQQVLLLEPFYPRCPILTPHTL